MGIVPQFFEDKKVRFINLTPHEIVLLPSSGGESRIPSAGTLARCKAERRIVDTIEADGVEVPVTEVVLGEIEGLPVPVEDTVYIVSLAVAQRAARTGRVADILVPDEAVRDDHGKIIGCRCLARQGL